MEMETRSDHMRMQRIFEMDRQKLPPDGGSEFNRLIFARSPYLLQHADNPVDWYEWGDAAFAKARAEDKPVFLSIGYATCHWCHVMAHESFEDPDVAAVLNRYFVSIKVDREERADIDARYMMVAQMLMGSGGWPLQIIMTPDLLPFYAVTYVPRRARRGVPGITELLEKLAEMWQTERQTLERSATAVVNALKEMDTNAPGLLPGDEVFREAGERLRGLYDSDYGGFGGAPKFPMPVNISFLLHLWHRNRNENALHMVLHTLQMMRDGGIYDQLGFGFHRYAVDRRWLVPHFEKMLYDQALLAQVYLEGYQSTGREFLWTVADEIFAFVRRELTSPEGGFYSALDADTEGEEGKYYLWSYQQIRETLPPELFGLFCTLYDVTEQGNFEGENILHLNRPPEAVAGLEKKPVSQLLEDMERAREILLASRAKRIAPFRDEKIITAWNALMVSALAKGYGATGYGAYLAMAERCIDFILARLVTRSGRLLRSYHLGSATIPGFLEDYAFLTAALIDLYQVTLEDRYIDGAKRYGRDMISLFLDHEEGGLFDTGEDAEHVLMRTKNSHDGVIPSGNAVAALSLLRLGRILEDSEFTAAGEQILRSFMGDVANQPVAHLESLAAVNFLTAPEVTVSFSGPRSEEMRRMVNAIHKNFAPSLIIRYRPDYSVAEGKATAHVCAAGSCWPPATDAEGLLSLIDKGFGSSS